jgi:hypothetical protein
VLKEVYESATKIRAWPVFGGLVFAALFAAVLIAFPSAVLKRLPGAFFGNTYTRIQWRVLNGDGETGSARRVYVFGGSQVVQAFPPAEELQRTAETALGRVRVLEAGFSGQSLLDSFILLTHLPVDDRTVVFVQASPSRLRDKAPLMEASRLFLDPSEALRAMRERGFDIGDADRTSRICRELIVLATRAFRPYDKFQTETRYKADPREYVARMLPRPATRGMEADRTEGWAVGVQISDLDILNVVREYVSKRGGCMVLFEMPRNAGFPSNMPGWSPREHDDPAVKQWLTRLQESGGKAESVRFDTVFHERVASSGVPYVSFHSPDRYEATDFYDSVHLLASGRDVFLPSFFDALKTAFDACPPGGQPTSHGETQ